MVSSNLNIIKTKSNNHLILRIYSYHNWFLPETIRFVRHVPAPQNEVSIENSNDQLGAKDLRAKHVASHRFVVMQIDYQRFWFLKWKWGKLLLGKTNKRRLPRTQTHNVIRFDKNFVDGIFEWTNVEVWDNVSVAKEEVFCKLKSSRQVILNTFRHWMKPKKRR